MKHRTRTLLALLTVVLAGCHADSRIVYEPVFTPTPGLGAGDKLGSAVWAKYLQEQRDRP